MDASTAATRVASLGEAAFPRNGLVHDVDYTGGRWLRL
jgi:hypothetical protein